MREFLIDTVTHLSPPKALENLAPEAAERRIDGAPHSIADIVAHMDFWQRWFADRCEGTEAPMVQSAAGGWPAVASGSWPSLAQRFNEGLERAAALGDDAARLDQPLASPIVEFPPLAHYTRRDALIHVAGHNAHHLGQVILLRQIMGLWPPPAGSWTW